MTSPIENFDCPDSLSVNVIGTSETLVSEVDLTKISRTNLKPLGLSLGSTSKYVSLLNAAKPDVRSPVFSPRIILAINVAILLDITLLIGQPIVFPPLIVRDPITMSFSARASIMAGKWAGS